MRRFACTFSGSFVMSAAEMDADRSSRSIGQASRAVLICLALCLGAGAMGQTTAPTTAAHRDAPKTVKIGVSGARNQWLYYPASAQAKLGLNPGDTLYINPGTYLGLTLGDLNGTAADHITIQADPEALFTTTGAQGYWDSKFPNVSFVDFKDFHYDGYGGRTSFLGASHDLLFKNFSVLNGGGDYVFFIFDAAKVFDGKKASTFYNFKWENCVFDKRPNSGVIIADNYQRLSALTSITLDFEISHCTFSHIGNGVVLQFPNSYNLQVHDCTFSDIGDPVKPGGHCACIGGSGYFRVYNNTFARHWGDDVRMFPAKLNALGCNGPDAVTRYYNNISYDKRKFAAFENNYLSDADIKDSKGLLSRSTSEVCFNTFYRSRKVDYTAPLCDVLGPGIIIKHNLIIEPECDTAFDPKRNYAYQITGSMGAIGVCENNLVFPTLAKSGLTDASKFVPSDDSPAKDAATGSVSYISTDHYGNPRYVGGHADVGAVEKQ